MKRDIDNVLVIAQKEFADSIWSPRFFVILGIFLIAFLVNGYQSGQIMSNNGNIPGFSPLTMGFLGFTSQMSTLGPLMAIVLGFDAIVRERKSGSLNVLLTHPVYRDQVITGKLIGMMVTLGFVVVVAVGASIGMMLGISGIAISTEVMVRIIVFMMLAFLFMLTFLSLSIATSAFTKESSDSLIYSIAVWVVLTLLLGMIAYTVAGIVTGEQKFGAAVVSSEDYSSIEKIRKIEHVSNIIMSISPSTHLNELIRGQDDIFAIPSRSDEKHSEMQGLFDTGFTLEYWIVQNWVSIVILLAIPSILLIISYMAFMRLDITL
ncbi:MAG: ABC transporter permease subunit [Candidatus Methanoperedens sp.]|nr:ABC transporter permease subunit [Candidatus Methanoperedens sp.]